jgi:hypothetical protein
VRLGLTRSYEAYMRERFADPRGEGSRRGVEALREFLRTAKGAGVPVALVLFPHLAGRLGPDYPFAYLHDRVLGVCAEESVRCLDLRDAFARRGEEASLRLNRFDHHAGPRAGRDRRGQPAPAASFSKAAITCSVTARSPAARG